MRKEELTVAHHNRNVSITYYMPDDVDVYPIVIMSHGYNGHQTDFAKISDT